MTGALSQLFQDSYGNLPPVIRALAAWADEQETKLERLRVHCNFKEDWSPTYDRTVRSGASAAVKWADKCGTINGMGDLHAFISELCAWADTIEDKVEEVNAYLTLVHDEALAAQTPFADAIQGKPAAAIVTCTKCGKSLNPKGAHFHTRNCKGLSAA